MTARFAAWAMATALVAYLAFAAWRAAILIADGGVVAAGLGIAVLVLPVLGAWVLWREISFGLGTQRLGRELGAAGGLPRDDLPRTAGGRVEPAAAQERFDEYAAQVEADPQDWRAWYRLAIAYDDARDRKRARGAMRAAIRLRKADPTPRP